MQEILGVESYKTVLLRTPRLRMELIHEQTIDYVRAVCEHIVRAIRTRNEQDLTAELGQRINVFYVSLFDETDGR